MDDLVRKVVVALLVILKPHDVSGIDKKEPMEWLWFVEPWKIVVIGRNCTLAPAYVNMSSKNAGAGAVTDRAECKKRNHYISLKNIIYIKSRQLCARN